jgi:arginase family enzyme
VNQAIALDLDGSLQKLKGLHTINLPDWQEAIRFGCSWATWKRFRSFLNERLPDRYGPVCMGSGDFHHISHLLLERLCHSKPFDVVVLDNHPDNMRFPFGIHCGSWVFHAARLPQIRCVHVLGITSTDVSGRHACGNHLLPIFQGKIRYWTIGVNTRWVNFLGLAKQIVSFRNAQSLIDQFMAECENQIPGAVYLSIDKDVLSTDVVRTNWDQGCFNLDHIRQLIELFKGKLIGSDITGEVSLHHYQTAWKRWLSAWDQQPSISAETLAQWKIRQADTTRQLLTWLTAARTY